MSGPCRAVTSRKEQLARKAARSIVRQGFTMEMVPAFNELMTPERFKKLADAFEREADAHKADKSAD
jgi:hypothetical protein